jgi:DNA mismatch repair protein MutS
MLARYYELRRPLPASTLVALRLGDFYEFFGEDARTVARLLNITLTTRTGHPMAGVPVYCSQLYFKRLLDAGRCIAVADPLQTSFLSPGTVPA